MTKIAFIIYSDLITNLSAGDENLNENIFLEELNDKLETDI